MPGINKIEMARYVYMGPGLVKELPDVIKKLGYQRPRLIIITGTTKTLKIAHEKVLPLTEEVSDHVEIVSIDSNLNYLRKIDEILSRIGRGRPDLLIGVGGGRVLDATKIFSGLLALPYICLLYTSPSPRDRG